MSRTTIFLAILATVAAIIGVVLSGRSKGSWRAIAITIVIFIAAPVFLHLPSLVSSGDTSPVAERFSDSAGLSDSNGFRKLMIALSLEMIGDKPVIGIGADNFGFRVHEYRERFAATNPDSHLLAYAENENPERAHNEYLQIAAELGIVGVAIFGWFLSGIALMAWRSIRQIRALPLIAFGAIVGMAGFLAAGLVTSYSFRLIQNGFFFFFALSIASKYLLRKNECEQEQRLPKSRLVPVAAISAGLAVTFALTLYCTTRVASVIYQERARSSESVEEADSLFFLASELDPENPVAYKSSGMRAFTNKEFDKAVPLLRRSIEMGERTSTSYSYLASAQILSGDSVGAEATLRECAELYPRSVFALARYASILETNGDREQALQVMERALLISPKAAATWSTLLSGGAVQVSAKAVDQESGILQVMDLVPQSAIYAVMSERLVKHPEEQKFSMFRAHN